MPLLFDTMPSAPIIIPITAAVVVAVGLLLLIFHLLRKLVGCPHHKSKYPFHDQDPSKIKSVLPTSPYTIDPSSTASSNSIYFLKGSTSAGAGLLYPALAASAPSRTPSNRGQDDSFDRSTSSGQDQTFSLDQVDGGGSGQDQDPLEDIIIVERSGGSSQQTRPATAEEIQQLIPRSSSALTGGSTPSPGPYTGEVEERTTYRQEIAYHRSERQEFVSSFGATGTGGSSDHYESDV